jgi:hypothetical protein
MRVQQELEASTTQAAGSSRRRLGVVAGLPVAAALVGLLVWIPTRDEGAEPVSTAGPTTASTSAPTAASAPSTTVTVALEVPAPDDGARAAYTGEAYPLTLEHPAAWQQVAGDPVPSFEGADGFLTIDGIAAADSVDEVCRAQAGHELQPFGTSPTIDALTVAGQEGCLILPSADQPADMRGAARVVVRLPFELFSVGYNFLVLDADAAHIGSIASSVRFLGHD